jgi:hypothetical protein
MQQISKLLFDALASYARHPLAATLATELAWFRWAESGLIATLQVDTDGEFSAVFMAPDLRERYRAVATTAFHNKPMPAVAEVATMGRELTNRIHEIRGQGDESGDPIDFFAPTVLNEKLHPDFLRLTNHPGYAPAKALIELMMRWHEDSDGNFVEQFQTTGFDARMWELYLFAALTEAGFTMSSSKTVPDFNISAALGDLCVEATTINPSRDAHGNIAQPPNPQSETELERYVQHYLPIRYAGPLTSKLSKRYWEKEHVSGKPLVFAIQDFHETLSMTWTKSALQTYLYGYRHESLRREDGTLEIQAISVDTHEWGTKSVPAGFYSLPEAEHVSAVLYNNSGTIAKFNRMGVAAGLGAADLILVREGVALNHDPDASEPNYFVQVVTTGYPETWVEGMDIYHNPNARNPLDPALLPGAAHHRIRPDGQIESTAPSWHPLSSWTSIIAP